MQGFIREVRTNPNIEIDRTIFPMNLPVFQNFQSLTLHPEITFFVGDNGSGKSTFMEAIAIKCGFPAEGGTKNHSFSTFDSHSNLEELLQIDKVAVPADGIFLRAESFYNVISYVHRAEGARFGQLHERSHGEGFLDAIGTLRQHGLYLLDEPESALSVTGQLTLLAQMKRLIQLDCQFLVATHSPILLGLGRGIIYELDSGGFEVTPYHRTKPYTLTLDFLRNRARYVKLLGLDELQPDEPA